jgi:peptide/nickel transport system ATP-binding protein
MSMPDAPGSAASDAPLLDVRNLRTWFHTERGLFKAVDGISFQVRRGRAVGLVGESGCGKSVTSLSLMGLVPQPPGQVQADALLFEGRDVMALSADERRLLRGGRMAMVFQEPMTSAEPGAHHRRADRRGAAGPHRHVVRRREEARHRGAGAGAHPVGGAAGRRLSAPAVGRHAPAGDDRHGAGLRTALLIADEPTTALDVTIQAQILDLLRDLQQRLGMAMLIITHDLGVIAELADEVIVMYAGQIVESAPVQALFADPQHPYTIGLLGSIPRLDVSASACPPSRAGAQPGQPAGRGCRFAPRCPFADARCHASQPPLRSIGPGHQVACWKAPVELAGAPTQELADVQR